ncbi:MAG: hypothetical protein WCO63_01250 [Bacteroidota bacterium]
MEGKFVIVRTYSAGVHAGTLKTQNGKEVVLTKSRRLWYWSGAASLSELAVRGAKNVSSCKFTVPVDEIKLTEAIEIIPCTGEAETMITTCPEWRA